ncbi:MAG: hypothetical protein CL583_06940 [Alteromonadaceae bacterium]|nr:hypothetical protein [Alteromonadaceae bacterium]|tara:strand:+ start:1698 stop:2333 length:636 start_codon:yes stop_codon:yes gene_type:complete
MPLSPRLIIGCLLVPGLTFATNTVAEQSLPAHVHGSATLELAVEQESVELVFTSPAMNIIGFEHAPKNEAQRAELDQALAWLEANPVVTIAGCSLVEASARSTIERARRDDGKKAHLEEHEHEAGHEERHEEGHDENHHEDHEDRSGGSVRHSEITVSQALTCNGSDRGAGVETPLFLRFPGIAEVAVAWVTETTQGGERLSPKNSSFTLD